MWVKIVDKMYILEPLEREGIWAHKIDKHFPCFCGFVLMNIYNYIGVQRDYFADFSLLLEKGGLPETL